MNKQKTVVERPVVYDGGFGFKVDSGNYPDLIGHLFSEFLKDQTEKKASAPNAKSKKYALEFIEFARQYLDKNPPQSQTYVGTGIAVKLYDGTTVTFSTQDATVINHRDDSIALNRPKSQPGQHGISDTGSISITTGQTKVSDARTEDHATSQKQVGDRSGSKRGNSRRKN